MADTRDPSPPGPAVPPGSAAPLGHRALVPPRIGPDPEPLPEEILAVYRVTPAAAVADKVGRLWTMDPVIGPLRPSMPHLAGVAITVKAPPGDNWAVFGGLNRAFDGAVLVVDWRGHTGSCGGGEKALLPARSRGLAGLVIDGAWRDVDDVAASGFPLFGRGSTPFSPAKRDPGEVNVPVSCGGVVVEPGDVVVGDSDGVVIVPRRHAEEVARALAEQAGGADAHDEDMVRRIGEGFEAAVAVRQEREQR
ncbi:MAG: RraA family protein [Pseudonocardia sediminis]